MDTTRQTEYVLGLHADTVREYGVKQGFNTDLAGLDKLMAHATLRPRHEAETDPEWKHFATYAAVTTGSRILSYLRTSHGGESRLHGLRSVGIGGHVNPQDGGTDKVWSPDSIERAAIRELHEEIEVPDTFRFDCIGFINDDSNPVGRVHIGLVYRCLLDDTADSISRETAIAECRMLTASEIRAELDQYETWSQFIIRDALDLIMSG